MTRNRLFGSSRHIDLHFDDEAAEERAYPRAPKNVRFNDFPPLLYNTQQTSRAVYLLARGVGEALTEDTARAVTKWFTERKGLKIERGGPARFPGPDGIQYEWFFRVTGVEGSRALDIDALHEAVISRVYPPKQVVPSAATSPSEGTASIASEELAEDDVPANEEGLAIDWPAMESVRANLYVVGKLQEVGRARVNQLRKSLDNRRKRLSRKFDNTAVERHLVSTLLEEAITREAEVVARIDELAEREQTLEQQEQWLKAEYEKARRRTVGSSPKADLLDLNRLFPRLELDSETAAVLQIEMSDNTPYLRLLAAMQDGVPMKKDAYPPCLKCVRPEQFPGASWLEVRLVDSLAGNYRVFYRPLPNTRLEVHIVFRRDVQRFIRSLKG